MDDFEELLEIGERLTAWSKKADETAFKKPVEALLKAAETVGRASSGSWLGYHAHVYHENFTPPPPGAHFSQEWGIEERGIGTQGDWREYSDDEVMEVTLDKAGHPDLTIPRQLADAAKKAFIELTPSMMSILSVKLAEKEDHFLSNLQAHLKDTKPQLVHDLITACKPCGSLMTRDTIVIGQGTQTPPHIRLLAEAMALQSAFEACAKAGLIALQAGSHMKRLVKKQKAQSRIGTNIFIGHGRSIMWRDLKDFIKDRLQLPYDEFNRVPVAGMTNCDRLGQMLDSAAIALLVMTAEDETADGKIQARMNVIHEIGLFQGRLGFSRAIILLEEGCEEFSNIHGLGQIRFPKGNISAVFEDIRYYLQHEGIIPS